MLTRDGSKQSERPQRRILKIPYYDNLKRSYRIFSQRKNQPNIGDQELALLETAPAGGENRRNPYSSDTEEKGLKRQIIRNPKWTRLGQRWCLYHRAPEQAHRNVPRPNFRASCQKIGTTLRGRNLSLIPTEFAQANWD